MRWANELRMHVHIVRYQHSIACFYNLFHYCVLPYHLHELDTNACTCTCAHTMEIHRARERDVHASTLPPHFFIINCRFSNRQLLLALRSTYSHKITDANDLNSFVKQCLLNILLLLSSSSSSSSPSSSSSFGDAIPSASLYGNSNELFF